MIETTVGLKGLGYLPDYRRREDLPLALTLGLSGLPAVSPDWPLSPATSDQGQIGSCTGQATADAMEDLALRRGTKVEWSRLWNYLLGRLALQGITVDEWVRNPALTSRMKADTGAMIRDVVAGLNAHGAISEALWPYDISKYADLPDAWTRAQARRNRLLGMRYLDSAEEVRVALHEGHPIVLGFLVYAQFSEVGKDGLYRPTSGKVLGGHAVRAVKHDATKVIPGFPPGAILCRNSWGLAWGCAHPTMADKIPGRGFFWIPDTVVNSDDVSDIWAFGEEPLTIGPPSTPREE